MGGKPQIFRRAVAGAASTAERFAIHTSKGDVAVLDFRKHPVSITEDRQTIEIEVKNDFQIVFNVGDSSFGITIDACKLSAYEGTTMRIDPQYAGQSYGFSFCPGTPQPRPIVSSSKH
jgi:hypothetical protein